jgi:predicted transcriptional regulator
MVIASPLLAWGLLIANKTTIRLPPKLLAWIHALAKQRGRSACGAILKAVARNVDHEEEMRSLDRTGPT